MNTVPMGSVADVATGYRRLEPILERVGRAMCIVALFLASADIVFAVHVGSANVRLSQVMVVLASAT